MVFIIGGAYQGKLDYAKESFGFTDDQVFTCGAGDIDFSKPCVNAIEEFVYGCDDPVGYFKSHADQWKDSVLICQDMSGGVVPLGADMRSWRQKNGRLCQYLSKEADRVSRIFCGLEQRLK